MKKLIYCIVFALFGMTVWAQEGVKFRDLTFDEALAKAKAENKMLFMDCYTSWCGPCKYMEAKIFPVEEVGAYMNPKFVCVKYDMEKGEGPQLRKKFEVQGFPTFIVLNPDGTYRHRMVGGDEKPELFLERVKETFDDNKAIGVLESLYRKGDRDKAFMMKYIRSLATIYSPEAGKVADELFHSLSAEERTDETYWDIFGNTDLAPLNSLRADYVVANREKFYRTIGNEKVDRSIFDTYQRRIMGAYFGDSTLTVKELENMNAKLATLKLKDGKTLTSSIRIAKAKLGDDTDALLSVCEEEAGQMPVEQFPYFYLSYGLQPKFTPAQKECWIKIGRQLLAKSKDAQYSQQLENFIKNMEGKTQQ